MTEQVPYDYPMVPRDQGDPGGHVYGDETSAASSTTSAQPGPAQDSTEATESPAADAPSAEATASEPPAAPSEAEPDPTTAEQPEPQASPTSDETPAVTLSGSGDLSGPGDPSLPKTMAEATMGDDPDAPVSSVAVHPSVMVRLADVYQHIENWAARHPELERFLAAELKSNISTAERLNGQGGAA